VKRCDVIKHCIRIKVGYVIGYPVRSLHLTAAYGIKKRRREQQHMC
jgi:hypothetical protein